jgi:hypothetical protein
VLSLLALLFSLIGVNSDFRRVIYLVIFVLVTGGIAWWMGGTSMRRARNSGTMRPASSVVGTVFGIMGAGLSALLLVFFALYWNQLTTYSQCNDSAITVAAQQACANQFHRSLETSGVRTSGSGG